MGVRRWLLVVVMIWASAPGAVRAAVQARLELPGPPVALIPADLDGDAQRDLLVVVAVIEWGSLATSDLVQMDEIEGLVEVMTVVPAVVSRRELHAFRGIEGGFAPLGSPLELPEGTVVVEAAAPFAPALAITGNGAWAVEVEDGAVRFRQVLELANSFAGVGDLVAELGLVRDLDGDSELELMLPVEAGLALIDLTPGVELGTPQILREIGDARSSAARIVRRIPLPEVGDLDGDGRPDLLFRDPLEDWKLVRIATGIAGGFAAPRTVELTLAGAEPILIADLDADGRAEVVFQTEAPEGEDRSLREELADAREPQSSLLVHTLGPNLELGAEKARIEVSGFVVAAGNIPLPGGFVDLDGDGHLDLAALTTDIGLMKALGVMASKRLSLDLGVNLWCGASGWTRVLPLDLSGPVKLDLRDMRLRRLAFFAGDFDGDKRRDFLEVGTKAEVRVRRGQVGCRYPARADLVIPLASPPRDPLLVKVLDLDGDGRDDIAVILPQPADQPGVAPRVAVELALSGGRW